MRAVRAKSKNRDPEKQKDAVLRYQFGISLADARALLALQNEKCPICGLGLKFYLPKYGGGTGEEPKEKRLRARGSRP